MFAVPSVLARPRLWVALVLLVAALGGLAPAAAQASPNGLVISEFRFRGPAGGNDEFVELLNTSNAPVAIAGYSLQGCASGSGAASNRVTLPTDTAPLQPGQRFLLVNKGSNGYPGGGDASYSTGFSDLATSNQSGARVVNGAGEVIDGVGSPNSPCREGTGITTPTAGADSSFTRLKNGTQDTNDNAADFAATTPSTPQGRGVVDPPEPEVTKIHEIQGAGAVSPLDGREVIIEGVVTGIDDEMGANFSRNFPEDAGIYVQEEAGDADDDPNTSEGIFVGYVRDRAAYPVGSVVRLVGTVDEKFGFTIISEKINTEPVKVGTAPLPEPVVIDPALAESQTAIGTDGTRTFYEALEGMRVRLATATATSGGTNKFGELFLTPGTECDRVFRTEDAPSLIAGADDAGAGDPDNPLRPERPSTTLVEADLCDTVQNLVGPLNFSFGNYKIVPQEGEEPTVLDTGVAYPYDGLQPTEPGQIRVASFNVENFFEPGASLDRGTVTEEEYAEKRDRIVDAIGDGLERPDVVALQEVSNVEILEDVAERLDGYTAYSVPGNDNRGIDVAFLIRDTVEASNLRQLGKDATGPAGVDCSDVEGGLFDRPPLAIDIAAGDLEFTIFSNHFASKAAPDACREAQAAFVRDEVAKIEAAGGQAIVAGDLNAFEDESPLAVLEDGTTSLTNQWSKAPAEERYSFQFNGRLQTLDHILVTDGLEPAVVDFRYAHIDNDYHLREGDPADGHHASDHDPAVLTLQTDVAAPVTEAQVESDGPRHPHGGFLWPPTVTLTADDDAAAIFYRLDGGELTRYEDPFTVAGKGTHTVVFYAEDAAGNREEEQSLTLEVRSNRPAHAGRSHGRGNGSRR